MHMSTADRAYVHYKLVSDNYELYLFTFLKSFGNTVIREFKLKST